MTSPGTRPAGRTRGQVLRFLIVGGSNTVLTYVIFIVLGLVMPPWAAYSIAFALGLAWTSIGSSRFVFGSTFSARRMLLFIGCYLVVYGIGQLVIQLIDPTGLPSLLLTSFIVLVCTTPLTFLIGRYIFGRTPPAADKTEKETRT